MADAVAAPKEQDLRTKDIDAERIRRASRDLSYRDGKSFTTIWTFCEAVNDFVDASVAREHNDGIILEVQIFDNGGHMASVFCIYSQVSTYAVKCMRTYRWCQGGNVRPQIWV